MKYLCFVSILIVSIVFMAACSSKSPIDQSDRNISKKPFEFCVAHADAIDVGYPSRVRLWAENTGNIEIVNWSWGINGKWYDATSEGGVFWLQFDKPGTVNALLRGVDKNGNDCTSSIKVRSRSGGNAAPVILCDGPTDLGEQLVPQADGTVQRVHYWGWDASGSYDPETDITGIEWGVYGGGDLDGDGIPDTLYAGITADGVEFSNLLGFWLSKKGYDYYKVRAEITEQLKDDSLYMVVTATDKTGYKTKELKGHVTLIK